MRPCALTAIFLSCVAAQCLAQEGPKDPTKQEWRDLISTDLSAVIASPKILVKIREPESARESKVIHFC